MRTFLSVIFVILFLAACGETSTQNFAISAITYDPIVYAGHSFSVGYTLTADKAISVTETTDENTPAKDLVIAFFLVDKDEFDAASEETEITNQTFLGSVMLEELDAGSSNHTATLKVPTDVASDGNYQLIAVVDPENLIFETNEDDNQPDPETGYFTEYAIQVSRAFVDVPNFFVKEVEFEDKTISLTEDTDLIQSLTPIVTEVATTDISQIDYPYHGNIELQGTATIQCDGPLPDNLTDFRAAVEIKTGGSWQRLEWWDNTQEALAQHVGISFSAPDDIAAGEIDEVGTNEDQDQDPNIQYLDFEINIPTAVVTQILADLATNVSSTLSDVVNVNSFGLRLILDSEDAISEMDESDNIYEWTVNLHTLPASSPKIAAKMISAKEANDSPYLFEKSYRKYVGKKKYVKTGIKTYHKIGLETNNPYGAVAKIDFEVPLWVFKRKNTLIKIYDDHQAYADWMEKTGYKTEIVMLNSTLFDEELWADRLTKTYEKNWSKEKRITKSRFVVGPVPVSVEVGVAGTIGFKIEFGLEDNYLLSENTLPDLQFDIYADGGVDAFAVSAGVTAALEVIDELFKANAYAEFNHDSNADVLLSATMKTHVVNDLEAVRGKFGVFVKWRAPKWCKKLGIPYPCGTKKRKSRLWFYKTRALYNKKQTLLKKEKTWNSF